MNCLDNIENLIEEFLIDFIISKGSGEIWNKKTPPEDYDFNVIVSPLLDDFAVPFLDYFEMNSAWVKTIHQSPGEMYIMHRDVGYKGNRHYIFLQDQMPGQFFNLSGKDIKWKKGDVYSWDDTVYHCSANAGLHSKISLTISDS